MGRIWAESQDQVFLILGQQQQFCSHSERCFVSWSQRIRSHAAQIYPRLRKHIPHKDSFWTQGAGHFFKEKKKSTMVFPVVRYESWVINKDECWRIYALELCGWRRLLRIPWTAGRSKQSILKEINPEYYLVKDWHWRWSSNTSTTWRKEPTHWKNPWC